MKKIVTIGIIGISFFVLILSFGAYNVYNSAVSFVDKCEGYRSVKFGMNVVQSITISEKPLDFSKLASWDGLI